MDPPDDVSETKIYNRCTDTTYIKGKLLGKGGFASVYDIRPVGCNQVYADKIISKDLTKRKTSYDKIKREISLHRNLSHPNIVQFMETFSDDNYIHIILEHCSMKSLLHVMKKRHVLAEDEVRFFLRQIFDGVSYIHHLGIVHRDLKLGNMFLTSSFVIKIGDFGLATTLQNSEASASGASGTLCGTPNYIAPEVLQKKGHGMPADIWAIGCMMYAMMSGNPPFETKSLGTTYAKIASNSYTMPPNISVEAAGLVAQLLHPQPEQRGNLHLGERHPESLTKHPFVVGYSNNDSKEFNSYDSQDASSDAVPAPDSHLLKLKLNLLLNTEEQKEYEIQFLHSLLAKVQDAMGQKTITELSRARMPVVVSKWIDYSNKYGFGYKLSDGTVGVIFNDRIRVSQRGDGVTREIIDERGHRVYTSTVNQFQEPPQQFSNHTKIMEHFSRYMEDNLADGYTGMDDNVPFGSVGDEFFTQVVAWARNDACVVIFMNNLSLQINFFRNHEKLLFWEDEGSLLMTMINRKKTFLLGHAHNGLFQKKEKVSSVMLHNLEACSYAIRHMLKLATC